LIEHRLADHHLAGNLMSSDDLPGLDKAELAIESDGVRHEITDGREIRDLALANEHLRNTPIPLPTSIRDGADAQKICADYSTISVVRAIPI
jgi:hypothetical protein